MRHEPSTAGRSTPEAPANRRISASSVGSSGHAQQCAPLVTLPASTDLLDFSEPQMNRATFYYDLGSPYAYLSAERISGLFTEAGLEQPEWQPILLGGLFRRFDRGSWEVAPAPARGAFGPLRPRPGGGDPGGGGGNGGNRAGSRRVRAAADRLAEA